MAWRNPWYSDKQPEDPFVDKMQYDTLKEKGFHYNEDKCKMNVFQKVN